MSNNAVAHPDTVCQLKPPQLGWRGGITFEDMSLQLPYEASAAGLTLTFEQPERAPDPVYLKDRHGNTLEEWRHTPSLSEVRDAALRYLAKI